MKKSVRTLLAAADVALSPAVYPAALLLKAIRRAGLSRMPLSRAALRRVGVLPVRNHYFEPFVDATSLYQDLAQDRALPGVDLNIQGQLDLLASFRYGPELAGIGSEKRGLLDFNFQNGSFESGDAEFLYNLLRARKPSRVFEIGSGNSTLMAIRAIQKNREEDPGYRCRHLCVEPYEMPWLERAPVEVIRERVERLGTAFFAELQAGDLLFIDSTHVIRPQGDVLFEYLQLLPTLNPGVLVHVHDIFTPRDYLREWVLDEALLWNEQYLLEAFLTSNRDWKVIGALNHLRHHHFDALKVACPYLTPEREPGSFYLEKVA